MAQSATESGYETLPDTGEGLSVTIKLPRRPGVLLSSLTALAAACLRLLLPAGSSPAPLPHSPLLPSCFPTDDLPGPAHSQSAPAAALGQHRQQQQQPAYGQPLIGQPAAVQGDAVLGVPAFPQPQYSLQQHQQHQQQQGFTSFPPCELAKLPGGLVRRRHVESLFGLCSVMQECACFRFLSPPPPCCCPDADVDNLPPSAEADWDAAAVLMSIWLGCSVATLALATLTFNVSLSPACRKAVWLSRGCKHGSAGKRRMHNSAAVPLYCCRRCWA